MSVVNVELPTDGLFLTLGNMMPPFLDIGFVVLALNGFVGIVFDWIRFGGLFNVDDVWFVCETICAIIDDAGPFDCVVVDGTVVCGIGGSVNSSISEYLHFI